MEPIPPRYWWLKRIAIAVGPVVLGLLGFWIGWGWVIHRQLRSQVAGYVAAGEPIHPADFNPPAVADEQNAAIVYLEAMEEVRTNLAGEDFMYKVEKALEGGDDRSEAIRTLVAANTAAFAKVRLARTRPAVRWKVDFQTPMVNALASSDATGLRNLAELLLFAATEAHSCGDVRGAVEYTYDAVLLANALDVYPTLIDHLVANVIHARAVVEVERFLSDIRLCEDPLDGPESAKCVPRERILELRDLLLGEKDLQASLIHALYFERARLFDSLSEISGGSLTIAPMAQTSSGRQPFFMVLSSHGLAFLGSPVLLADTRFALSYYDQYVQAARAPTWPGAGLRVPRLAKPTDVIDEWLHSASRSVMLSVDFCFPTHYRTVARRRLAAVALAIRLYEQDHGRRPGALEELVPAYIGALPIDPYGDGRRTFHYLPNSLRPRVYSIGANGVDDHGEVWIQTAGRRRLDSPDTGVYLDGPAPRSAEEFFLATTSKERPEQDDR